METSPTIALATRSVVQAEGLVCVQMVGMAKHALHAWKVCVLGQTVRASNAMQQMEFFFVRFVHC